MKHTGKLHLHHEGRDIVVELEYSPRKNLVLAVLPSAVVKAKIPPGFGYERAEQFIRKRAGWIDKNLRRIENDVFLQQKYFVDGEKHPYLGDMLTLRLHPHEAHNAVKEELNELHVYSKGELGSEKIEKLIQKWYREEARRVLAPRFHALSASLSGMKLKPHSLRFYRMKRRWGSCSSKGVITLNTELIKKAPELIEYVILHELCHLKVPAHNRAFYALLESVLPDWKTRRRELNGR
jgi:predicted metal-dependent hydrolase